jgi:hypothetical protein
MLRESTADLGGVGVLEPEAASAAVAGTDSPPAWSPAKRIAFRFLFSYFFLYIFPFPLEYVPFLEKALGFYQTFLDSVVTWVGRTVFHVTITVQPNGSGDTTWNYVQLFIFVVLALAATVVWSILDRRRTQYARLYEWLRVYVRLSLAVAMLSYGAFKIIKSQFPAPTLDRLMQPYGDSSPMGLLWTFMGASTAYTFFGGLCEAIGGALLAFRRTTLLGALVSAGVMVNVVMLNFSYDVPVKLYSSHLLLIALFLAAPDLRRLLDFFVLHRTVEPVADRPLFQGKWAHRGALALRTVFFLYAFGFALNLSYQGVKEYEKLVGGKTPLYGLWTVEEMTTDGQVRPPLITDAKRWRRMIFEVPGRTAIQLMDDSRQGFTLKLDAAKRAMSLTRRGETKPSATLTYQQPAPDVLVMDGVFDGKKVRAKLRKTDVKKYLLVDRGFHWINEYPFNR